MRPQLEELLKTYDAFKEAGDGPEAERLFALYRSRLEDVAAATGFEPKTLDMATRQKYLRWLRANARISSIPPKA